METVNLIIKQNGEIPQIGDTTWMRHKGQVIYCVILSIKSVKYDERFMLHIVYEVKVIECKGMRLIKG